MSKQSNALLEIEVSINSTDARNGINIVNISKQKYLAVYNDIDGKGTVIEEKVNKRGKKYFSEN